MIFVTVGSQKFQFNRLLKKIDELIEEDKIKNDVIAQTGVSTYPIKHYASFDFLSSEQFEKYMKKADLIITHGGTGTIVMASKMGKKIIGVPRLVKYGEHVDDHQMQILQEFKKANLIEVAYTTEELEEALRRVQITKYNIYHSNPDRLLKDIEKFIEENT